MSCFICFSFGVSCPSSLPLSVWTQITLCTLLQLSICVLLVSCLPCWIITILCMIVWKSELIPPLLFQIWGAYVDGLQVWTPVNKPLNRLLADRVLLSQFVTPLNDSCSNSGIQHNFNSVNWIYLVWWMFTVFGYVCLCFPSTAFSPVVLLDHPVLLSL